MNVDNSKVGNNQYFQREMRNANHPYNENPIVIMQQQQQAIQQHVNLQNAQQLHHQQQQQQQQQMNNLSQLSNQLIPTSNMGMNSNQSTNNPELLSNSNNNINNNNSNNSNNSSNNNSSNSNSSNNNNIVVTNNANNGNLTNINNNTTVSERPVSSNSLVATSDKECFVDITAYLNLPQTVAAKKLGMPTSTLSKRWREAVRNRKWPYRVVNKLDKEITTLLHNIPQGPGAPPIPEDVQEALGYLLRRRQEELRPVIIRV
eukprot:TRINITY_DN357_c1_g1_i7.p1 TRINITY_DN357_c1_g1~~TRINITY_DN357_c1_g1_i7.p1  ORF type:complete len:260 (-),score=150.62 TRINITY_DN357_c1_g1_i7:214-993(-)